MNRCFDCGLEVSPIARVCPRCGRPHPCEDEHLLEFGWAEFFAFLLPIIGIILTLYFLMAVRARP